jgi:hypothetical protein
MIETLNAITHAIKLLENRKADAAEDLLKQEVINIHRRYVMGIIASKEAVGEEEIKKLLDEAQRYLNI